MKQSIAAAVDRLDVQGELAGVFLDLTACGLRADRHSNKKSALQQPKFSVFADAGLR